VADGLGTSRSIPSFDESTEARSFVYVVEESACYYCYYYWAI